MKTFAQALAVTAISITLAPVVAQASDRIVVLSDAMPVDAARTVLAQSKRILAGLEAGDTVTFIDGRSTNQIAQISLPEGGAGDEIMGSTRKISKHFGPALKSVQDYAVASAKTAADLPNNLLPFQVNLPGVLYSLSTVTDRKPDVIVLGSLRYQDDNKMPGYAMVQNFPNDAHRLQPPSVTPFGAAGMEGVLAGTRVHFCDLDTGYVTTMQAHGLERATGLLIQGYGATFATYTSNIPECISRAVKGQVDEAKAFTPDASQTKMVIYDATMTGKMPSTTDLEQLDLLSQMKLPEAQKIELQEQISSGNVVLAEAYLYDTQATDGDVVALISGSVRITVSLTKTSQKFIVPISNGSLKMIGVKDGQGGITVGVRTKSGDVLVSPVMRVGETIELPFLKLAV